MGESDVKAQTSPTQQPTSKKQKNVEKESNHSAISSIQHQIGAKENREPPKDTNEKEFLTVSKAVEPMKNYAKSSKSEWTKVEKKKHKAKEKAKKRQRLKRTRPDALIIAKTSEGSYADILRKVKSDPKLQELGENVALIRRTRTGQLLIELSKSSESKSEEYQGLVKEALGEDATVRSLTQETILECRYIDEVSNVSDVYLALKKEFGDKFIQESCVKNMRKAYGDTQTAIISLPTSTANEILKVGKVKIGWTVCPIRAKVQPKSCFRCLEYGHMKHECTGIDRSKVCMKCGTEGHIAKLCIKPPNCYVCQTDKSLHTDHAARSFKCPKYRLALKQVRV